MKGQKVIVSGASGLLGRAVFKQFQTQQSEVKGLAHSRAGGDLVKLDLHDEQAVEDLITSFAPSVFVHCAAERRPDVAEADPEGTRRLNVKVPETLAKLSKSNGFTLVYISTDYVFDGHAPEGGYEPDAKTNPLQLYGETKLAGEHAIIQNADADRSYILRVPVLYGEAEENKESAINILLDPAQAQKPAKMDNYATRYPTYIGDVAKVIYAITLGGQHGKIPQIVHFSSQTLYTKYKIATLFAELSGNSGQHLIAQSDAPGPEETPRPRDCHLSNAALKKAGVDCATVDFEKWWKLYLTEKATRQ